MTAQRSVFIMVTGPYRNVGDSLIRRRALSWARDLGSLVVMLSGSPSKDWEESLDLQDDDMVIRSKSLWIARALRAGRRPVLVVEPGEFNTDRRFFPSLAFLLIVSTLVRLRGGAVIQMPRSLAMRSTFGDQMYRLLLGRTEPLWREEDSRSHYGVGAAGPDIGFDHPAREDDQPRDLLVVSLRGDRPAPTAEWSRGVHAFAEKAGLSIVVLSQVERDNERCGDLAVELQGSVDLWRGDVSSTSREHHVREVYRRTSLVLSDRLHALVIGAVEGAAPVEVVPAPNGKARKHFAAIGVHSVSFNAESLSSDQISAALAQTLEGREEVRGKVARAAAVLSARRSEIRTRLGAHGSR